jgi:hypothetical protein
MKVREINGERARSRKQGRPNWSRRLALDPTPERCDQRLQSIR